MKNGLAIILVIMAISGVYFLSSGITGEVISQSCCFPPDCPEEYLCEAATPHLENPESWNNYATGYIGLLMISMAMGIFYFHHRKY
ncbi:MAG: hypothetical protein ABH828_04100 [archaeon]